MAGPGDRRIAGLLSALAEAPDFDSTASFFLTQLAEIARTPRALLLQFDAARENLNIVASVGFETPPPVVLSIGDIGSPIVVAALTMRAMRGTERSRTSFRGSRFRYRSLDIAVRSSQCPPTAAPSCSPPRPSRSSKRPSVFLAPHRRASFSFKARSRTAKAPMP